MLEDFSNLAIGHLKRKKLRSALTIIGIFISIATIFVIISLSIGLDNAVKEQFRILGTDKILIGPKGQAGPPGAGGAAQLSLEDVDEIRKVRGVNDLTYYTAGNAKIEFDKQIRYTMVIAFPPKEMRVYLENALKIEDGRRLKENDKGKIIIGNNFKNGDLFKKPVKVGDKFLINGREFEVVGIQALIGNPQDDAQISLTDEDFKELFNSGDRVDGIMVQIKPGEDIQKVSETIKKRLLSFRGLTEKTIDFEISTPEELLANFKNILNIITAFLFGVAFISMVVGGIGIANTMYTSVLERTKEIGTMKAIGARNIDIMIIFVIESGILGLIGGVLGVLLGVGIGKIIDFIAIEFLKTNLLRSATPLALVVGCLLFAFFAGIISGILPSFQASKIRPADTLRYE